MDKAFWKSKTLWANGIAILGILAQDFAGTTVLLEPDTQATLLATVNIVLRLVTKGGVTWA